jgi:UPF0755 protein
MLRWLARLAATLFGVGLAVAAATLWVMAQIDRPGPLAEAKTLIVPKGGGVMEIGSQLQRTGVISNEYLFIVAFETSPQSGALKAGEYVFPAGISMRAAVDLLQSGKTVVHRVTVPEGLTTAQVLELLDKAEGLYGEIETRPAEGTLLPETYHYSWGDNRQAVVDRMRSGMKKALDDSWAHRAANLPFKTKEEAVVLASIVERETGIASERPHVAAVFINRLRHGMKLQSDPTVIYGLSDGKGVLDHPLTKADLAAKHPYNTYLIDGLPPAPIANPGHASLQAVMHPDKSDDLYFVADGSGGHAFAKTLTEHNRNVANWRRVEKGATE